MRKKLAHGVFNVVRDVQPFELESNYRQHAADSDAAKAGNYAVGAQASLP